MKTERQREGWHPTQGKINPKIKALGPDFDFGSRTQSSATETMNNIRYILNKHRHEMDEEPYTCQFGQGRPRVLTDVEIEDVRGLIEEGMNVHDVCAKAGISQTTFYRIKNGRGVYSTAD